MKLYLITQSVNNNYDTFDSAVVAAENEEAARKTHPDWGLDTSRDKNLVWSEELYSWTYKDRPRSRFDKYGTSVWTCPKFVDVEYIGEAADGTKAGCILASFNAG